MSRHPELGAGHPDSFDDSGKADHECDYCGRTIYTGLLRQVRIGSSTSWLCQSCFDRQQAAYADATGNAA